jgi:hypothetical protein
MQYHNPNIHTHITNFYWQIDKSVAKIDNVRHNVHKRAELATIVCSMEYENMT